MEEQDLGNTLEERISQGEIIGEIRWGEVIHGPAHQAFRRVARNHGQKLRSRTSGLSFQMPDYGASRLRTELKRWMDSTCGEGRYHSRRIAK